MSDKPQHNSATRAEIKVLALSLIQAVGTGIALCIHLLSHDTVYGMNVYTYYGIAVYLLFLTGAAVVTGFLCRPLCEPFFAAFSKDLNWVAAKCQIPSSKILRVVHGFVIADFLGLAFFICLTGGSEQSFFAPFLFVVTTVVVLVDLLPAKHIFAYALLSVMIFALGLSEQLHEYILLLGGFKVNSVWWHKVCLWSTTSLCFLFPLAFDFLEKLDENKSALKDAFKKE